MEEIKLILIIITFAVLNGQYDFYLIDTKKQQITEIGYFFRFWGRWFFIFVMALAYVGSTTQLDYKVLLYIIHTLGLGAMSDTIFTSYLNKRRGLQMDYLSKRGWDLKMRNLFGTWLYFYIKVAIILIYITLWITVL
jgi:hypothetical protein